MAAMDINPRLFPSPSLGKWARGSVNFINPRPLVDSVMEEPNTTPEEMRPIAVHVEKIVYDVDLKHTYRRRVAVVDLEFSKVQIEEMVKQLQKRIEEKKDRGSIRIRYKGPMVLE